MTPLTFEWIEKADGDYQVVKREMRVRKLPNYDAVCFHVQQCVEKYLKAILQERGIPFAKTHDLTVLLDDVVDVAPLMEPFRESLDLLTSYAVEYRYPGDSATKDIAREAMLQCKAIRSIARSTLGLPDAP